jgi:hypothetical protein
VWLREELLLRKQLLQQLLRWWWLLHPRQALRLLPRLELLWLLREELCLRPILRLLREELLLRTELWLQQLQFVLLPQVLLDQHVRQPLRHVQMPQLRLRLLRKELLL